MVTMRLSTSFLPGGTCVEPTGRDSPGAPPSPPISRRISSSSRRSSSGSGPSSALSMPCSSSSARESSESDSSSEDSSSSSSSSPPSSELSLPALNPRRAPFLSESALRMFLKILLAASFCSFICCWMPTLRERAKRLKPLCSAFLSWVAAPDSSRIKPILFQRCSDLIVDSGTPKPFKIRSDWGMVSLRRSASVPVTVPGFTLGWASTTVSFGGCRRT